MNEKVQDVTRLHRKAMEFADESRVAKLYGDLEKYLHYTRLALEREAAAADMMVDEDVEPTRSVLHRSAATLAWRCEEYDRAKRLIYRALGGNPPTDIEYELYNLLGKVKFELAGIELGKHKVQFGLQGREVGFGTASARELNSRIIAIEDLVRQTIRFRNRSAKYRPNVVEMAEGYRIYQGETEAASFIVHLTLGRPRESMLPGFVDFDQIVSPLIQNLGLLQDGQISALEDQFDEPADYASFMNAAKSLAPDGDKISSVNLQARIENKIERLFFKRSKAELREIPLPDIGKEEEFQATYENIVRKGVLKVADDRETPICVLITDSRKTWYIEGPEDIIEKIGRSYWRSAVEVEGIDTSKSPTRKSILVDDVANIRELPSGRYLTSFAFP
ncbi:MAG: hypothetical protein OXI34_11190 [Chloroflexota bacterium]|nr:hypothetical protein [Chloroflexota bacterium]MDE2948927.1 hypothetical protein [Chloroflexota bacterium]